MKNIGNQMRQGRVGGGDGDGWAEEAEGEPGEDGQPSPGWGKDGGIDGKRPDWKMFPLVIPVKYISIAKIPEPLIN